MSQTVVIVGGGAYGVSTAKRLANLTPNTIKIHLISATEYASNLPGSIRLIIHQDPKKIAIPINDALKEEIKSGRIQVTYDTVSSFNDDTIELSSNKSIIKFDLLVLATGCVWPSPVNFTSNELNVKSLKDIESYIKPISETFHKSKSVAIIGGGDIGIELIGELAHDSPDKSYYVIHNQKEVLSDRYVPSVRKNAMNQLKSMFPNVKYYFNSVGNVINDNEIQIKNNATGKEEILKVDVVYQTIGPKPNVPSNTLDASRFLDSKGYISVKSTFQSTYSNKIFALGDVSSLPYKGLVLREEWLNVILNNIKAELGLTKSFIEYNLPPVQNINGGLSIGPTGGVGQAKVPFFGICSIPKFVIVKVKSSKLFYDELGKFFS